VSYDKAGGVLHPGDFKSQEAFRALLAHVKAAGGTVESILKVNIPASTLVAVPLAHPDWLIEVEAIAVIWRCSRPTCSASPG
jgi:enamine deaminase RidA (YjgF/YER057c/UK114 family)